MGKGLFANGFWALLVVTTSTLAAEVPLGGFIPFVGIGLTDEFETFDTDPTGAFSIADPSDLWGGSPLGPGSSAFFDIALLDTGASAHILTQAAASSTGFDIQNEGFQGTAFQPIYGAAGVQLDLLINDAMGIYAAGLGDRVSESPNLVMGTNALRGQTSVALLEGDADWTLPNILGLPMAAQQGIVIRNDQPQIFSYQGRTMRTPQVDFIDLGTGNQQGILRRTDLRLRPSASFLSGPIYAPDLLNFFDNGNNNPTSPTVIENGGLYLEVDVTHQGQTTQNTEFLFDTGADVTVLSEVTAASVGFDFVLDEPDFVLEVEGAGGVLGGIPGFYLEEMKIDAVGGSLTFYDVPIAVLNVPNPVDPANVIDAIIGMHLFAGRNLVIDAIPAAFGQGSAPSLYISDPVTDAHQWSTATTTANWSTAGSWSSPGVPGTLWAAQVGNVSGSDQQANVTSDSTVFQLAVSGTPSAKMTVEIQSGSTLTIFGETIIEEGGEIRLDGGKLDAPFVNINGGSLSGSGDVFVGTGPINGVVRNLSGRIEPDSLISITGDLSNLVDGTIAIDLFTGGNDLLAVSRSAFLSGTLEVSLLDGFDPTAGQTFTILTYGGTIDLNFSELLLPTGYDWDLYVDGPAMSLVLEMVVITGDFDGNGTVNAADLAVWEAGYGQPNGYTGADFLAWQRNLGMSSPLAAGTSVPEPGAAALVAIGLAVSAAASRKKSTRAVRLRTRCQRLVRISPDPLEQARQILPVSLPARSPSL